MSRYEGTTDLCLSPVEKTRELMFMNLVPIRSEERRKSTGSTVSCVSKQRELIRRIKVLIDKRGRKEKPKIKTKPKLKLKVYFVRVHCKLLNVLNPIVSFRVLSRKIGSPYRKRTEETFENVHTNTSTKKEKKRKK